MKVNKSKRPQAMICVAHLISIRTIKTHDKTRTNQSPEIYCQ
jgi:hypothetical protein